VDLDESLASVAAYGAPGALDRLKEHLDPLWIEEALTWSGTTSIVVVDCRPTKWSGW
jgi:hypothetical protein